jgi:hypothetical protein
MSTQRDQAGQTVQSQQPNPTTGTAVQIIDSYGGKKDAIMIGGIAQPTTKT